MKSVGDDDAKANNDEELDINDFAREEVERWMWFRHWVKHVFLLYVDYTLLITSASNNITFQSFPITFELKFYKGMSLYSNKLFGRKRLENDKSSGKRLWPFKRGSRVYLLYFGVFTFEIDWVCVFAIRLFQINQNRMVVNWCSFQD